MEDFDRPMSDFENERRRGIPQLIYNIARKSLNRGRLRKDWKKSKNKSIEDFCYKIKILSEYFELEMNLELKFPMRC